MERHLSITSTNTIKLLNYIKHAHTKQQGDYKVKVARGNLRLQVPLVPLLTIIFAQLPGITGFSDIPAFPV